MKTAVIVNPRSAGGKTGARWPALARLLEAEIGPVETRFTERPGHATTLARELLEAGFDRLLSAGGDGTLNEVVNGFLRDDQPVRLSACLGILPLGTGGDFRRTLGAPANPAQAIVALRNAAAETLDVGRARYRRPDGSRGTRYFINLVSFGMGGEVASRSPNLLSKLGGTAAFLGATAVAFFVYRRKRVRLRLDDAAQPVGFEIYNVAVGNGRFHGGGMQVCPTANPADGILEVTVIEYLRRWEAIRDFPILYSNNLYRHPKVKHLRARTLVAEADEAVLIEVDGEPLGTLPLEITLLPQRLRVLVPRRL